jgi:hypothetical protein
MANCGMPAALAHHRCGLIFHPPHRTGSENISRPAKTFFWHNRLLQYSDNRAKMDEPVIPVVVVHFCISSLKVKNGLRFTAIPDKK